MPRSVETNTKMVNIFAVGNVLDPHISVEGKCRACRGEGSDNGSTCEICGGEGRLSELVRLSEVLTVVGPAMKYVDTIDEPIPATGRPAASENFSEWHDAPEESVRPGDDLP